jgi:hypothetical protein
MKHPGHTYGGFVSVISERGVTEGDVDQHRDSFQGLGYRKVMSHVNKGGMHVQTWRSNRRGDGN